MAPGDAAPPIPCLCRRNGETSRNERDLRRLREIHGGHGHGENHAGLAVGETFEGVAGGNAEHHHQQWAPPPLSLGPHVSDFFHVALRGHAGQDRRGGVERCQKSLALHPRHRSLRLFPFGKSRPWTGDLGRRADFLWPLPSPLVRAGRERVRRRRTLRAIGGGFLFEHSPVQRPGVPGGHRGVAGRKAAGR